MLGTNLGNEYAFEVDHYNSARIRDLTGDGSGGDGSGLCGSCSGEETRSFAAVE